MKPTYEEWKNDLMYIISKRRRLKLTSYQAIVEVLRLCKSSHGRRYLPMFYWDIIELILNGVIKGLITIFAKSLLSKNEEELTSIFIKSLLSKNEEWRGFISEQKHGWRKEGLTKHQIDRKIAIFFFALYWGRFKSRIQLLRILSWIKTR